MILTVLVSFVLAGNPAVTGWSPMYQAPMTQRAVSGLRRGNKRFVVGKPHHPAQDAARRRALVKGQSPEIVVLSCSDSRVPPEIVFDRGLGQLFVIRTAGEALDFAAVASVEYAVAHFHPKLLLVLGHDYCGAVSATLTTPRGASAGSPDLDKLVDSLRPHLIGYKKTDDAMEKAVRANATGVAEDLMKRSAIVRKAVSGNAMGLAKGIYHLKTGVVDFW